MRKSFKKNKLHNIPWISGGILFLAAFICIIPFILVVSISFSSEDAIKEFGYTFIPREFDLTAYRYVFSNWERILTSYVVTTASGNVKTPDSTTTNIATFGVSNSATQNASNWTAAPEPTSGLLMLLGIAGLALRRKCAKR